MISLLFLIMIIYLGIFTTFEDIISSRIRNNWILVGMTYCLTIYLLSWILYQLATEGMVSLFIREEVSILLWNFDKWCVNLAVSTVVAYLLWYFKMWGAGDAKLFIAYAALIPMGQYHRVYFHYYFASFLLLVNIFIFATIFIFLQMFFHFMKKINFKEITVKEAAQIIIKLIREKIDKTKIKESFKVLLGFFCLFLFFRILDQEFKNLISRFFSNQNVLILILLFIFRYLSNAFKKGTKWLILTLVILMIYFLIKSQNSGFQYLSVIPASLGRGISIMILFSIFSKIANIYEENTLRKNIPFAVWMFIGTLITWFI